MRREYVHELFSAAAERFAGRTAIDAAAGPTTYRELEEASNRLANFLIAEGAPKGSPVAVVASDVAQIVAAVLGTLKAGCAFVPVDPNLPAKRIEAMFSEVSPEWLVVEASAFDRVKGAARPGARVVCVSGEPPPEAERGGLVCLGGFADFRDASRPPVTNEPDDLCSVYFTSGSTGKPKGIAGRLKGIDHFIRWEMKTVGADESARVSQLTSPSFDGFLKDVFVPLCAGGTVCVPEGRDIILDGRRLVDWIDEARLTVLHCVPSVFRSILNEGLTPERFGHLRHVLLAGEPLLPSDVARWTEVFSDRIRLTNLYGPTETTVVKLFYHVRPEDRDRRSIPIGQPMEGAAAIVMDAKGRPCPPGAVGEIYIRTPFRALGYYNRPEQTREVFVPNPFNDDPADIIYRTGDFGRVAEDGLFEFLGRRDQQVKVRGVRVELGEVENALRAHPSVRDAAVVDREDLGGHKYLCAYVVAGEGVGAGALRRHLAESLPEYMLPSAFVLMERLPRTFNGKLDRRALPSPEQARRERPGDSTGGPRTPTEELLSGIWSRVLGLQRVGPEDNFFELGGHSLLATQVMTRVRDAFQIELPLHHLFAAPTLGGLAAKVEQAVRERHGAETPRVERAAHEGEPPLSFPQQRMWTLSESERDGASYNVHANLRLEGALGVPAFADALAEVVRRHEALRTVFPAEAGRPRQVILPGLRPKLAQVDLSGLDAEARERLAARLVTEEARRPFDLSEGPLLRAALLRLGPGEHLALFTMHHIVSDGWSLGVLTREVSALYGAFRAGRQSPLVELEIQYADFARWQREWLRGEALEARLAYWRGQLAGAPETLRLPADRPRRAAGPRRGANLAFTLDAGLAEKLKALSRREGVTLYMTLLAGFQTLLHRLTGQDDVVVGTPIANRNQAETEALVGCFVNTLALRTSLAGDPTFRELLGRVRETALGAYAHQDVPFEAVTEALQRGAGGRRAPLFRVWFVLQNAPLENVALEGVSVRARGADLGTAQFDLTLMMAEGPQGIGATLNYDSEMFDAGTAAAMAEALQALLAEAAEDADRPVLALRLGAESAGEPAARAATADEAEDQFVL